MILQRFFLPKSAALSGFTEIYGELQVVQMCGPQLFYWFTLSANSVIFRHSRQLNSIQKTHFILPAQHQTADSHS